MRKTLIGALLSIVGMALVFFSGHFAQYQLWVAAAGLVIFLVGSSMVTALKDYIVQTEWESKRKADKSRD